MPPRLEPKQKPKSKRGGPRPGGGRPSKTELDYQVKMRTMLQSRVTPEDWLMIVDSAISWAKAGKGEARDWLTPWVMGPIPKEAPPTPDEGDAGVKGLLAIATNEELPVLAGLLARAAGTGAP